MILVASENGEYIYLTGKTTSNDFYVQNNNGSSDVWISKIETVDFVSISQKNESQIICYPNPTSDYIVIENMKNQKIRIYDISGRVIFFKIIASNSEQLDFTGFCNGMYILHSEDSNPIKIIKI
jgi:Secretion system C-terminal sorting domain